MAMPKNMLLLNIMLNFKKTKNLRKKKNYVRKKRKKNSVEKRNVRDFYYNMHNNVSLGSNEDEEKIKDKRSPSPESIPDDPQLSLFKKLLEQEQERERIQRRREREKRDMEEAERLKKEREEKRKIEIEEMKEKYRKHNLTESDIESAKKKI